MQLPSTTHLQFLVLGVLRGGPTTGRALRGHLQDFQVKRSGPAFYQLMARMEDGGLVEGWYVQQVIEGQIIRERHYRITAIGTRAWQASRDFYLMSIRGVEGLAGA